MKVGVIGNGFVGGATQLLKCKSIEVVVWDILPDKRVPLTLELSDLAECDFIFICVPTPMTVDNSCHTGIVEKVVNNLHEARIDFSKTYVVIRSTVPPGTSSRLGCYFMPEFLTEANWRNDFLNCQNWVIGCSDKINNKFLDKFTELIEKAYNNKVILHNNIIPLTNSEAEMTKYVRNSFLATKVSFFNEIEELCRKLNINYESVRKATVIDTRIGESHTLVPGPDSKRGYGGTCLPKDINAICKVYEDNFKKSPPIISQVIQRNEVIDRPEREWRLDPRAKI